MMAKIWIISEYYYPVVVTTGYYVTEIAEYLVNKGLDVGVITSNNSYYKDDISACKKYETHNGVTIYRKIHRQIDKDSNKKRIWRLLSLSLSFWGMSLSKIKKGDQVIVLTNPAFFLLFMPLIRFMTKCKYHILVHDIFPENLSSIKKINQHSKFYSFIKKMYDFAYRQADSLISLGHDMSNVLSEKTRGKTSIKLITNWADTDKIVPKIKECTKVYNSIKNFAEGHIIFLFAGNLGKAQGLDNIMAAISKINTTNARFLFIGAGAKSRDINEFAENNINTYSYGFINRSQQSDFLNACDIGIVTLAEGMYGLGVPSKSYNIMAAGRPILYIGEEDSEIGLCIKKYDIGWVVKPNSPDKLKEQIEYIVKDSTLLIQKGIKARKIAETIYGKNNILEQYYQYIIEQINQSS